jgi:hypothetical protein
MAKKTTMEPRIVFDQHATPLNVFVMPCEEFVGTVFAPQLQHESRTEAAHGFMG